jgi:PadR family transcriptional regulator AphA
MKTTPSTKYAILGALMSGPKHGYEILRFLASQLEPTWHISSSQLYLLLRKLEADRLLQSNVETQENRPSKRVFVLTSAGRKEFLAWMRRPTEHVRDLRIEFLARLFFFNSLSLEGGNELIEAQMEILKQIGKRIRQKQASEKDNFKKLVLGFKIATIEAWITWLIKHARPFMKRGEVS